MTTVSRPPGRPRDAALSQRFIDAAIHLIAERGLDRLNSDVLARHIQAGKAGFYRRWASMDHFLADVVCAMADVPVVYPQPPSVRTDLAALVLHQVDGDRGYVTAALMPHLRHSPVLQQAWLGEDGPEARLDTELAWIATALPESSQWFTWLQRGVQRIVADLREQLLVHASTPDVQFVLGRIDQLLDDIAERAARSVQ